MNPSPQVEFRPQSALQISTLVVLNIIWWMVMIVAISLGAIHLNSCPVQPYIPIYLIMLGATSILSLTLTYIRSTCEDGISSILISTCMALLHVFSFSWFIAGTVWVYPIYPPSYTPSDALYCHKTTYQFAFIITTLVWVTTSLIFVCGCCFALLTCGKTVIVTRRLIPSRSRFYGATSDSREPAAGDV